MKCYCNTLVITPNGIVSRVDNANRVAAGAAAHGCGDRAEGVAPHGVLSRSKDSLKSRSPMIDSPSTPGEPTQSGPARQSAVSLALPDVPRISSDFHGNSPVFLVGCVAI